MVCARRSGGLRRATGTLVLAALLAAGSAGPLPTAAAVEPSVDTGVRDVLVVDVVNADRAVTAHSRYDSAGTQVPVAGPTAAVLGGVRLGRPAGATTGPSLELLPADGVPLQPGTWSGVLGQWTTGPRPVPVLRLAPGAWPCTSFLRTTGSHSRLEVAQVTHDAQGTVTSLSASWQMPCSESGSLASGEIRYRSAAPYSSAESSGTHLGPVVASSRTAFTTTVRNTGGEPLTLGRPQPVDRGPSAPRLELAPGEDCSGAPLAPGASCTMSLEYVDDGVPGGGNVAELRLAAPALARGHVAVLATASEVIERTRPPAALRATGAYDGVGLQWNWDSRGRLPEGYRVRRVDGPEPVLLATLPWHVEQWVDTSLAKGEAARYQVSAYNAAGDEPAAPVDVARLDLPDPPAAVDRRTLVMDGTVGAGVSDTATGGTVDVRISARQTSVWAPARGQVPSMSVDLPRGLRPGTYEVRDGDAAFAVRASGPPGLCSGTTGTAEVREAWVRADGTVHRLTADLHLRCGDLPVEVSLRIGTGAPFTAVTVEPGAVPDLTAQVGAPAATRDVLVRNDGTGPVDVGQATVSGDDAAAFSVDGGCGQQLEPGASCQLQVSFAPLRSEQHSAWFDLPMGTAVGSRRVALGGTATGPPLPRSVLLATVLGRVQVRWPTGPDGGSPVTGYEVQRSVDAGPFETVADLSAATYSWLDTAVTPGRTYRYRLVTANAYGRSSPGQERSTGAVPGEELLAAVRTVDPGDTDLMSIPVGGGQPVPMSTGQDTDLPAVSPDGRTVAYVVYDADGDAGLWLRPLTGAPAPRQLVDAPAVEETDPAWSPDGRRVCYSRLTASTTAVWCVAVAPGAAPAALVGGTGSAEPSWLPDGSGLVATDVSGPRTSLVRLTLAGARTPLPGTAGGNWPAVSPRGDRVAYVYTDTSGVDRLRSVPIGGGAPVDLAMTPDAYERPVWSPDGAAVAVPTHGLWDRGAVTVHRLGQEPVVLDRVAAGYPVEAIAWRRLDTAAPTVTFSGAPAKTAAAARIPVQVVDDTVPVGGLTVGCTLDGVPVARCTSGWSGTLKAGTHRLTVTATDPHGRTTTATRTWIVDTAPPAVSVAALPAFALTRPTSVSYGATDAAGVASYDVRYRRAAWSDAGFSGHTVPAGWAGTTARSKVLPLLSGFEHCVSVRARDTVGNLSAWSPERCTALPLDDRALTRSTSGWSQTTAATAYGGTLVRTSARTQALTRTGVRAKRLSVVVTTCPTCGSVDVLIGATRIGTLSLTSATTVNRVVRTLPLQSSIRAGTVTLRSTTSGRPVIVDGLGLRRT